MVCFCHFYQSFVRCGIKVFHTDLYHPYRAVPPKSTVGGRFRPSAVDFGHRRSIEGEKGKKKKKKKKKKKRRRRIPRVVLARMPSPPVGRPRAILARTLSPARGRCPRVARERFFSRAGRKIEATSNNSSCVSLDSYDYFDADAFLFSVGNEDNMRSDEEYLDRRSSIPILTESSQAAVRPPSP
ncbi:hypothetical protein GW17_00006566, partial [Ensete ventricosum]